MKLPNILKAKKLKGKRVLIRVDFNVPIKNASVADDFRIQKALPTLKFLRDSGAKIFILSHIGREKTDTLLPVSKHLEPLFPHTFISDFATHDFSQMQNGDAVLLDNLRKYDGEKAGDKAFAKSLSLLGDVYVNEAFPVSHRKDASVFALPKLLPAHFGPLFIEEFDNLSLALKKHKPFLVMLGGAKFETKLPLVKKYLKTADAVFVGGALANDFYKLKKCEIGTSLVDDSINSLKPLLKAKNLLLPSDVVVDGPSGKIVRSENSIESTEKIMDDGPDTVKMLESLISKAKFVLWNGPFGNYEAGFDGATVAIAEAIGKSNAHAVVGGGDTVAAIEKCGIKNKNIFVSTAGGAMLDFLANGTLPGIEAIIVKKKK